MTEYDLFVCHASEDKDEIARPLAIALKEVGFTVWFDEFTLTLGDSLRRKIDSGLAHSRFGVVILSEDFFKKEWPQRELDGLVDKESDGKKVILPLWHKIDRAYVAEFSPILASRLAVSTNKGLEKVVNEILRAVKPSKKSEKEKFKETVGSTVGRLDFIINLLRMRTKPAISKWIRSFKDFAIIQKMFQDVLDAVAFFGLSDSESNSNIFYFIQTAILEREREEGAALFEKLIDWYFSTTTPNCKFSLLLIFARLTTVLHLKNVISQKKKTSFFVAEFGNSNSFEIAGINTKILQNLQIYLNTRDCKRIVDYIISNDQILGSYAARNYLGKILSSCEEKADPETRQKIETIYGTL